VIKNREDTRLVASHTSQRSSTKISAPFFKNISLRYSPHHRLGVSGTISMALTPCSLFIYSTHTLQSFNELSFTFERVQWLLPSSMCILLTTLLNCPHQACPFQCNYQLTTGPRFSSLTFPLCGGGDLRYSAPKRLFSLKLQCREWFSLSA